MTELSPTLAVQRLEAVAREEETLELDNRPRKDEPDPELIALAGAGNSSILRPILMLAVIVLGAWIISDWRTELEYFASSSEPVALGNATEFALREDAIASLPHNRYVSITGIPTQRSQAERYRFFRLVGAPIFVEEKRDDIIEDPLERELQGDVKGEVDRTMYEGSGRLLKFSEMSARYGGLRYYYESNYQLRFCESLTPQQIEELRNQKRDGYVAGLIAEYEAATPEVRIAKKLSNPPNADLVEQLLDDDPVCHDMWLLQTDVKPSNHIWYVVVSLLFLAFMTFNAVMIVRWVRDFFRA